jgi:hypothetical protein
MICCEQPVRIFASVHKLTNLEYVREDLCMALVLRPGPCLLNAEIYVGIIQWSILFFVVFFLRK